MSITSSITESTNSHFDMFGSREKPIQTTNPYDTCDVTMLGENALIPSLSGMKIPLCYANEKMPAAIIEAAIAEVGTLGVFKDIRMGSRL